MSVINALGLNGISEKIGVGMTMSRSLTDPPMQILISLVTAIPAMIYGEYLIATKVGLAYTAIPFIVLYLYYQFVFMVTAPAETEKFLTFKDSSLKAKWGKRKIPMHILVEEFLVDNIEFKKDCYETLINHREEFIDWRPNWDLISFILKQIFPISSSSFKSISATAHEIADHYDRGNDFFNAFLGPKMIYTSAFYKTLDENLEQAQVHPTLPCGTPVATPCSPAHPAPHPCTPCTHTCIHATRAAHTPHADAHGAHPLRFVRSTSSTCSARRWPSSRA